MKSFKIKFRMKGKKGVDEMTMLGSSIANVSSRFDKAYKDLIGREEISMTGVEEVI